MSTPTITAHLASLIAQAEAGVDYSPRIGAVCPACGRPAKIYATRPWDGPTRVRYHHCRNTACLLCALGKSIKSVQVDTGMCINASRGRTMVKSQK
jgi:hypothetical protein